MKRSRRSKSLHFRTDRGIYQCRSDRLIPVIPSEPETFELPIPEGFIQEEPDDHVWSAIDRTLYRDQTPVFELATKTKPGVWSEPVQLTITVAPSFYETG